MHLVGEKHRRVTNFWHLRDALITVSIFSTRKAGIEFEIFFVNVGERFALGGIFNNDPVPSLAVAASWRLQRQVEAFFDDCALDRAVKVKSLAHTAGG